VSFKRFIQQHRLALLISAYMLLAVVYGVIVPVGEGVDEIPHFAYVRYLKEGNGLPIQSFDPGQSPVFMGHHPPLYYLLGGALIGWIDTSDYSQVLIPNPHFVWSENDGRNGWNVYLHFGQETFPYQGTIFAIHVLRVWSTVMGAVAVWAIYRAALLVTRRSDLAFATAGITAFNPSFLFMTSTVHHDSLMAMIGAVSLLWLVRAIDRPLSWKGYVTGGMLLAAGLLTKLSGLSLIVLFGMVIAWIGWRQRSWRALLVSGLIVYGAAVLLAGWWYVRNQMLYGDLLGWDLFLSTQRHMVRAGPYGWVDFVLFITQLQRTYWGAFGYMHITLPAPIYNTLWVVAGIACIGAAAVAFRNRRRMPLHEPSGMMWAVLLAAIVLWFASFVRFSIATVGAGHGRYLFPVSGAVSLLIVVGLGQLVPGRLRSLPGLVLTGIMFAYAAVAPFVFIQPLYTMPQIADADEVNSAALVNVDFGGALRLVAYRTDAESLTPGTDVHIDFYWQALGSSRPDFFTEIIIVDREDNLIGRSRRWPADNGTSIMVWNPDTVYTDRRTFRVADAALAGPALIKLIVREGGRNGPPVEASRGAESLGDKVVLLSLPVESAGSAP